jgi:hypothetical protein
MDRILVLSHGELLEFGLPATLLQDQGGALSGMVDAMGDDTAGELRAAAATAGALLEEAHKGTTAGASLDLADATGTACEARLEQPRP